MKFQGVEILRITDFRRFFVMEEFLVNSKQYAEMFQETDLELFCNNMLEGQLISQLRAWCSGKQLNATFNDGQISLIGDTWMPLGNLAPILNDFREIISYKDRLGLAYLFLLLKDAWTPEMIRKGCETFLCFKSDKPMGDTISLHHDIEFPLGKPQVSNVISRYLINIGYRDGVKVKCGSNVVKLEIGDCVVGLFNEADECICLLPNRACTEDNSVKMRMKVDVTSKQPYVEIFRKDSDKAICIKDVSSFWIEPGGYVVVFKKDGFVDYDSRCYSLKMRLSKFNQTNPGKTIVAAVNNDGFYTFYYK